MIYKYLYIQSKEDIKNHVPIIIEVFSAAINVSKYKTDSNSITLYFNHEVTKGVTDIVYNLVEDMYIDLRVYESLNYKSVSKLEEESLLIKKYLDEIPFHLYTYINNSVLLHENLFKINKELKQIILQSYYNNIEMIKTIKTYLECDQNMSNAAKVLYLHRNTLNQRLEKFTYETGFNIKGFKDAFLIYHLVK